jgi:S-adenosylmethionine hydrolase
MAWTKDTENYSLGKASISRKTIFMPIVLLTDFGHADGYAGILHGVIAKIAPEVRVIDLAHGVPPFDLLQANLILYRACPYFPKGSIFVVVVDPGVGGSRNPILVETDHHYFIGPDNGVFTLALSEQKVKNIFLLQDKKFFLTEISSTFHGRDIFAPAAAHLARGTAGKEFGPPLPDYLRLADLEPKQTGDRLSGKIISIDRFGNAVTNLKKSFLKRFFPDLKISASVAAVHRLPLRHTHYAEGKAGEALLLFGSSALLEIAVYQGSAAEKLDLKLGDEVEISAS